MAYYLPSNMVRQHLVLLLLLLECGTGIRMNRSTNCHLGSLLLIFSVSHLEGMCRAGIVAERVVGSAYALTIRYMRVAAVPAFSWVTGNIESNSASCVIRT